MSRAADRRSALRFAAAALLAATAGAWGAAPAQAAECSGADGVTVVVDFSRTGGSGIETSCVTDGGGDSASKLFAAAGHSLTRVQRQPGAVCKVDGLREQDECVNMPPGNAFWGLFWSDGDGGWAFSQEGVDSLNVPDGGSVAWAWQNGGDYDYPGTSPASHSDPSAGGSGSPSGGGGSGDASGTGSGDASGTGSGGAGPSAGSPPASSSPQAGGAGSGDPVPREAGTRRGDKADRDESRGRDQAGRERERRRNGGRDRAGADRPREEANPSADAPEGSTLTNEPTATADVGLPAWVAPAAIGTLFAAAGLAAYLRRRAA